MSPILIGLLVLGGIGVLGGVIFTVWMLGYVIGRNEVLKELGQAEAQRDEALTVLEDLSKLESPLADLTAPAAAVEPEVPGPHASKRGFGVSARSRRPGGPQ
jgi:hypothetical protein